MKRGGTEEKDEKECENPSFQAGTNISECPAQISGGAFSFIEFVSLATFGVQ